MSQDRLFENVLKLEDFMRMGNNDNQEFTQMQKYILTDILHTGNHGAAGESKQGAKYDERRGKTIYINPSDLRVGRGAVLIVLVRDEPCSEVTYSEVLYNVEGLRWYCLHTTPYVDTINKDGYVMLRTINSVYKLKPVNFDETDTDYLRIMHLK